MSLLIYSVDLPTDLNYLNYFLTRRITNALKLAGHKLSKLVKRFSPEKVQKSFELLKTKTGQKIAKNNHMEVKTFSILLVPLLKESVLPYFQQEYSQKESFQKESFILLF